MRLTSNVEKTLRRYVLGKLREDERLEVEEQLVMNPDAFEALGVVEDELTEEYLDGTLPAGRRADFERSFLGTAPHRRLPGFVRALKQRASERATARGSVEPSGLAGWWSAVQWRPVWAGAMVAAVLLLLAGNAWFALRQSSVQQLASQAREQEAAERRQRDRLAQQLDEAAAHNRDLAARLEEERQLRARTERSLKAAQDAARTRPSVPPTFALSAGVFRGEGTLTRIAVPPDAVVVRLRLELGGDTHPLYRAVLHDADGDDIWAESKLRAEFAGGHAAVFVVLPAALLSRGDYQIKLSGTTRNREPEPLATYTFRVTTP